MNDCKHDWMVEGMAEVESHLMPTEGYLSLTCVQCGAHAQLQRPTFLECFQTLRLWAGGGDPGFTDNGDDRLVVLDDGPVLIEYPNDHPGIECAHKWTVRSTMYDPRAEKDFLELECDHCGAWACVHDVTMEEAATISKMWDDGLCVNWGDDTRVTFSTIPPADDDNGGMVADLVNALDLGLEVESDEDIPF